jgi:magnesium-transporting ATPase (P-type)
LHLNFTDDEMDDDDDDKDSGPIVDVGSERIHINLVTEQVIARMTPAEKESYVQQYQEYHDDDD